MQMYPSHLNNCVEEASSRFPSDASDVHKHYQIVCSCGGRQFDLLVSDKHSVVAVCEACETRILIYDLAQYPAAVKIPGAESFDGLKDMPIHPTQVFVRYEYGASEPDMKFDRNDITWCQVFAEAGNGNLVMVFDDETC